MRPTLPINTQLHQPVNYYSPANRPNNIVIAILQYFYYYSPDLLRSFPFVHQIAGGELGKGRGEGKRIDF